MLGLAAAYLVWQWLKDRTDVPTVALGHSAGEFAALVAAGSISLRSALQLCWERGRIAEQAIVGRPGRMAAVFTGPVQAGQLTSQVPGTFVATVNGPGLCVIAGWSDPVEELLRGPARKASTRAPARRHRPLSHAAARGSGAGSFAACWSASR